MGLFRQEYWSGSPFPSPGDLPKPGIEPVSPALQVDSTCWATREALQTKIIQFKTKPNPSVLLQGWEKEDGLIESHWALSLRKPSSSDLLLNSLVEDIAYGERCWICDLWRRFSYRTKTGLDHSELLCGRSFITVIKDRKSFWHRHQKGGGEHPSC